MKHIPHRVFAEPKLERKDASGEQAGADGTQATDGIDTKKAIADFMKTFDTFTKKVDDEIKQLKKSSDGKTADPVTADEVKRLNDQLDEQKSQIDQLRLLAKRPQLYTGADGEKHELSDEQVEHKKQFDAFFRKGHDTGLREVERKALTVGTDTDGGYLVPTEMEAAIDRVVTEISPIRQIARVVNVSSASYKKRVSLGGANSGWVGETASRPQTDTPTLAELEFPVMEIYANPAATQSMLDDAALAVDQWLADEVNIEFAQQEGAAFVNGNGATRPRGFLQTDKVQNDSWAWGSLGYIATGASGSFKTTAEGDDHDNLIDLIYSLKPVFRSNARFVMNRKTQATVRKMKDADGNPYWQPDFTRGQPATLMGYPITEAEDMPDISADSYSIAWGDFQRGYLIVNRMGVRVLRDPFSAKPYVQFYTTKRVGGGVSHYEAIKLLKFGTS